MKKFLTLLAALVFSASLWAQATVNGVIGIGWGDSTTAGTGAAAPHGPPWLTVLGNLTGNTLFNAGVSGNTSTQILTRMQALPQTYGYTVIILSGFNNSSSPSTVLANIAAQVALLSHQRYVVLSLWATDSGSLGNVRTINAALASTYGTHYLDIFTPFLTQYNPNSPADVAAHAAGLIAPSQIDSGVHPNTAGHLFLGTYMAKKWLVWQP